MSNLWWMAARRKKTLPEKSPCRDVRSIVNLDKLRSHLMDWPSAREGGHLENLDESCHPGRDRPSSRNMFLGIFPLSGSVTLSWRSGQQIHSCNLRTPIPLQELPTKKSLGARTSTLKVPLIVPQASSCLIHRSTSLAIPHRKSFVAIPSLSLVLLRHTSGSVKLSHESQREIALLSALSRPIPYYQQGEVGGRKRPRVSQGLCF